MYLSSWSKLIFLFAAVLILIILNKNINLDSIFGLKQKETTSNSSLQKNTPTPTDILTSPTSAQNPSVTKTPTPTIIKSIPRIRGGEFEDD